MIAGRRDSVGGLRPLEATGPQSGGATPMAFCFGAGLAIGWRLPGPMLWPWLLASVFFLLVGAWILIRAPHFQRASLLACGLAAVSLGTAWMGLRTDRLAANDLAALLGQESVLVELEGRALRSPELRERTGGALARFDYRPSATWLPIEVDALLDSNGDRHPVRGRVITRINQTIEPLDAGTRLRLMGFLIPPDPPRNPGEFDAPSYARAHGQAGILFVPNRDLVTPLPTPRTAAGDAWRGFRDRARARARGHLLAQLPEARSPERNALLRAILLGERDSDLTDIAEAFQRAGVAHLLAISGLHLGILAGLVLLIARAVSGDRAGHGWLIILIVLGYLFLIEVRTPVLRAGVMTCLACAGLVARRDWPIGSLVSISALILLIWQPHQLFNPGFQLSYGVVLGLIYLSPRVMARLPGGKDQHAGTTGSMFAHWLRSATAVAITSWLVASPIIMYHFGFISPVGIPLSIAGVPIVAAVLSLGYLKLMLELFLPSVALFVGVALSVSTDTLIAIVLAIDSLPGMVWQTPFPSAAWSISILIWLAFMLRGPRLPWITHALLSIIFALWLIAPFAQRGESVALRIDMISVGDGSCFVVRSGGETFLFDAGSNNSLNAARRWILPAMRRLGVRSIDAIAISHPDIDHYGAVLDIADAFPVGRVLLTDQFLEQSRTRPFSPVAHTAAGLVNRRIPIETASRGHTMNLGRARLTWHHPDLAATYRRDNEHSMVIDIDVAGRRILLTGDLEFEGMARLMPEVSGLRADVVKLPHHGSFNELAAEFIPQLEPTLVLQSTGRTRWLNDRWADVLGETTRLVTYRDGAAWVEIAMDGSMTYGTYRCGQVYRITPEEFSDSD